MIAFVRAIAVRPRFKSSTQHCVATVSIGFNIKKSINTHKGNCLAKPGEAQFNVFYRKCSAERVDTTSWALGREHFR